MKEGLEVEEEKADYTWAGQFMCLSDCHAKKITTPVEKQVLQKAVLGLKKIKFSAEDDQVAVYNQLTGTVESDETASYLQLKKCVCVCVCVWGGGGFELLRCIPNCKVLESIEVVMSAENLKVAAGQGKISIRPVQRSLSVFPLKSETSSFSTSVLKKKCVYCLKEFSLQSL